MGGTKGSHFVTPTRDSPRPSAAGQSMPRHATAGPSSSCLGPVKLWLAPPTRPTAATRAAPSPARPNWPISSTPCATSFRKFRCRRPTSPYPTPASAHWPTPLPPPQGIRAGGHHARSFFQAAPDTPLPIYSIVGGKLTTCRSLAEEAAATLLADLGRPVLANSRDRTIPGAKPGRRPRPTLVGPARKSPRGRACRSRPSSAPGSSAVRTPPRFSDAAEGRPNASAGPRFPWPWPVEHSPRVGHPLADLVERRLMLLYQQPLERATLEHLAELLVAEGSSSPSKPQRGPMTIERPQSILAKPCLRRRHWRRDV